jgi:hypothetical protein
LLLLASCGAPEIKGTGGQGGSGPGGNAGSGGAGGAPGGNNPGGKDGGGPSLPPVSYPDAGPVTNSDAGPATGPTCAAEVIDGKMVPVDLLLLVDISGSMEESAGAQSKWVAVRDAFDSFVKDPGSRGLGVGLVTFPPPSKKCTNNNECASAECEQKGVCSTPALVATTEAACNAAAGGTACLLGGQPCTPYGLCARTGLRCANMGQACAGGMAGDNCMPRPRFCVEVANESCPAARYETPVVAIADLPGVQPAISNALGTLVPQGGTPTTPAVQGALNHLRARAMAIPDRKPVLVLATDGLPTGCGFTNSPDSAAAQIMAARMGAAAIPTYVIGVFQGAQLTRARPALEMMATAGGTGMPFVLMTGTDLKMRFLEAINQIRGTALACEFTIPRPTMGSIDFQKVNVRYTGTAGAEDLRYVESADRCDPMRGGWYYDVPPAMGTPTRVRLCAATCDRVKAAAGGSVQLRFGCKTIIE